jgi:hypothetical protein
VDKRTIQRKRPAPLGSTAAFELKAKNTFYLKASDDMPEADQGACAFVRGASVFDVQTLIV